MQQTSSRCTATNTELFRGTTRLFQGGWGEGMVINSKWAFSILYLASYILVGNPDHQTILGSIVFVLVLGYEAFTSKVVGFALCKKHEFQNWLTLLQLSGKKPYITVNWTRKFQDIILTTTPLEFDLESLEIGLVFDHFNETLRTKIQKHVNLSTSSSQTSPKIIYKISRHRSNESSSKFSQSKMNSLFTHRFKV